MNQTNATVPQSSTTEQIVASNAETEPYKPKEIRNWLQDELRLAKVYWQEKIQPFIIDRKLRHLQFEISRKAYSRVEATMANARQWNAGEWPVSAGKRNGDDGKHFPIPAEGFLATEKFRKPEPLLLDKSLKPETLAMIAAPMIGKRVPKLLPSSEAVRIAHDLLTAAQDYLDTFRERQTRDFREHLVTGDNTVSFDEIEQSNEKEPCQLPLLPTVQTKRNRGHLKLSAIRAAVSRFYKTRTDLPPKKLTEAKENCLLNNRIPLSDLCAMRWERFKNFSQKQQLHVLHRKPRQSKRPKKDLPKSAGTSPISAGRQRK